MLSNLLPGSNGIKALNQGVQINKRFGGAEADRTLVGQIFHPEDIAREDFRRNETAQDNQLKRDLYMLDKQYEYNSREAEKQRDYDREMSNTEIARRMADLKNSGLNPVLAVTQGGASYSGGTSAHVSGSRSSSSPGKGFTDTALGGILSTILHIGAGLYTAGAHNATSLALGKLASDSRKRSFSDVFESTKFGSIRHRFYN